MFAHQNTVTVFVNHQYCDVDITTYMALRSMHNQHHPTFEPNVKPFITPIDGIIKQHVTHTIVMTSCKRESILLSV